MACHWLILSSSMISSYCFIGVSGFVGVMTLARFDPLTHQGQRQKQPADDSCLVLTMMMMTTTTTTTRARKSRTRFSMVSRRYTDDDDEEEEDDDDSFDDDNDDDYEASSASTAQRGRGGLSPTNRPPLSFPTPSAKDFDTALCIVPPTELWDRLQRARHQARDPSFQEWPPAIRLFHPFFSANSAPVPEPSQSSKRMIVISPTPWKYERPRAKTHIAFEVAQVLEALEMEPFDITLDEWSIIPNVEAIQAEYYASQKLPTVAMVDPSTVSSSVATSSSSSSSGLVPPSEADSGKKKKSSSSKQQDDASLLLSTTLSWTSAMSLEDQKTQLLIEREEIIGREKKVARALAAAERKQQRDAAAAAAQAAGTNVDDDDDDKSPPIPPKKKSPFEPKPESEPTFPSLKAILENQQKQYDEFNGPCILCLEPNATSKQLLCELRAALQEMLPHSPHFSPSSIYGGGRHYYSNGTTPGGSSTTSKSELDNNSNNNDIFAPQSFRPMIPISAFGSVSAAMKIAKRLKGLWDPLTIPVTELQIVSRREDEEGSYDYDGKSTTPKTTTATVTTAMESESSCIPWGCNAKIQLPPPFDEEQDEYDEEQEEENQKMLQRLLDEGSPGGGDISMDYTILEDDEEEPASSILEWLNDDEDWDEGTTVVIGRTTFFTGDKRIYVGMPATSSIDAKDRFFGGGGVGGDGSGAAGTSSSGGVGGNDAVLNAWGVSGAARRRTTVGRGNNVWNDGDYGHRASDYSPFTNREQSKTRQNEADQREVEELLRRGYDDLLDEDDDETDRMF
jgi:hypothetical protein